MAARKSGRGRGRNIGKHGQKTGFRATYMFCNIQTSLWAIRCASGCCRDTFRPHKITSALKLYLHSDKDFKFGGYGSAAGHFPRKRNAVGRIDFKTSITIYGHAPGFRACKTADFNLPHKIPLCATSIVICYMLYAWWFPGYKGFQGS